MMPESGTGGLGIGVEALLSCRANAGILRDSVGLAAARSAFAAALCIAAMVGADNESECLRCPQ